MLISGSYGVDIALYDGSFYKDIIGPHKRAFHTYLYHPYFRALGTKSNSRDRLNLILPGLSSVWLCF